MSLQEWQRRFWKYVMSSTRCSKIDLDASSVIPSDVKRADYICDCGELAFIVEEVRGRSKLDDVNKLENTMRRWYERRGPSVVVGVIHHKKADPLVTKSLSMLKQRLAKEFNHVKIDVLTAGCEQGLQSLQKKYDIVC